MIRPLTVDDVPRISAIEYLEQIKPLSPTTLYRWFYDEKAFGWGLEDEQGLYGYTIATIQDKQCHSKITCIMREKQNAGEGRALCWHALQEIAKMGADNVVFEVRRSNIPELKMVSHFGAFQIGERPNYYGDEDALIMQIDLKELRNE